jgi:hypothetical protein
MRDGCVDSRQSRCPSLAKTSGITDSSASALDALLAATLGVVSGWVRDAKFVATNSNRGGGFLCR